MNPFEQFIESLTDSLNYLISPSEAPENKSVSSLIKMLREVEDELKREGFSDEEREKRLSSLKASLWMISVYVIGNKRAFSKLQKGQMPPRLKKELAKLGLSITIQHTEEGRWRLLVFAKSEKVTSFKAEGTSKKAQLCFVFDQDHWQINVDLTVQDKESLQIKMKDTDQDAKAEFKQNPDDLHLIIIPSNGDYLLVFLNPKKELITTKINFIKHPVIKAALEEENRDERQIKLNSPAVRQILFKIVSESNGHEEYQNLIKTRRENLEKECQYAAKARQYSTAISPIELVSSYFSTKKGLTHHLTTPRSVDFCTFTKDIKKISFVDAILLTFSAFHGLQAIHKAGLRHQDISLDNLLVDEHSDGYPESKISDFGSNTVAVEGEEAGKYAFAKPGYLAPEPYLAYQKLKSIDGTKNFQNLYDLHFVEHESHNRYVRKLVNENQDYKADIIPHKANDTWAMAMIFFKFLGKFIFSIDPKACKNEYFRLVQCNLIIDLSNLLSNELELPREQRKSSDEIMNWILDHLREYEDECPDQIKITEIIKKRYDKFNIDIKETPDQKNGVVKVKTASKTEATSNSQIISSLFVPEKLNIKRSIKEEVSEIYKKLENYNKTLSNERQYNEPQYREYDRWGSIFKLPRHKKEHKWFFVNKLMSTLTADNLTLNYDATRKLIKDEHSRYYGVMNNGRLGDIVRELKAVLALDYENDFGVEKFSSSSLSSDPEFIF